MKTFWVIWPLWTVGILCLADAMKIPPSVALFAGAGLVGLALSFPQLQAATKASSVNRPHRKTHGQSVARSGARERGDS